MHIDQTRASGFRIPVTGPVHSVTRAPVGIQECWRFWSCSIHGQGNEIPVPCIHSVVGVRGPESHSKGCGAGRRKPSRILEPSNVRAADSGLPSKSEQAPCCAGLSASGAWRPRRRRMCRYGSRAALWSHRCGVLVMDGNRIKVPPGRACCPEQDGRGVRRPGCRVYGLGGARRAWTGASRLDGHGPAG